MTNQVKLIVKNNSLTWELCIFIWLRARKKTNSYIKLTVVFPVEEKVERWKCDLKNIFIIVNELCCSPS